MGAVANRWTHFYGATLNTTQHAVCIVDTQRAAGPAGCSAAEEEAADLFSGNSSFNSVYLEITTNVT